MKIKQIIINNIASIENATIDFEAQPLASADVFLIAGNIGSGKTTILDCVCLALYGETPRLPTKDNDHKSSDDWSYSDTRRFVRNNAAGGSAKVVFEAEGERYCAEWQVNVYVKGANKGKLSTVSRSVKNLTTGAHYTKVREVTACIESVIGLDFSQFCRTSMLAQGEFAKFLKSPDQEKADILQKITGVDIYQRIGKAIYEATAQAKDVRERLATRLKDFTVLSDEERALRASTLAANAALDYVYRDELQKAQACHQWLETQQTLTKKAESEQVAYHDAVAESSTDDVAYNRILIDVFERTGTLRANMQSLSMCQKTIKECSDTDNLLESRRKEIDKQKADLPADFSLQVSRDEKETLREKLSDLRIADTKCTLAATVAKKVKDNEQNIANAKILIANDEKLFTSLTSEIQVISGAVDAFREAAESLRMAAGNDADKLRVDLKIGEKCPVCRQVVAMLPSSPSIKEEYDKAVDRYNAKRRQLADKQNESNRVANEIKLTNANLKRFNGLIDTLNDEAQSTRNEAETACKKAGCTIETIKQAVDNIPLLESKIKTLDKQIRIGEKVDKETNKLNLDVASNDSRRNTAQTQAVALTEAINSYRKDNEDITDTILADVVKLSQTQVDDLRKSIAEIDTNVVTKKASYAAACEAVKAHISQRPEYMDDAVEIATLDASIAHCETRINTLAVHTGAIRQQLDADFVAHEQMKAIEKQLLVAENDYNLHQRLNKLIGDKDGKTFSRIALSYVLGNLIDSANLYLRSLTDRYTLHVVPGTYVIQVCDAWQNSELRTVNTTSGGESFLISLAMALALSDLGGMQDIDTLFIDEGFGSLSGDDLRRAVDALSTLHKASGRQVGIISHIPELRERIPVQIYVKSEPNMPSSVSVIG